jgi:hypothetical protein
LTLLLRLFGWLARLVVHRQFGAKSIIKRSAIARLIMFGANFARTSLALVALTLLAVSPADAQSGTGKPIVFNGKGFAAQIAIICILALVLMILVVYHRDLKMRGQEQPEDLTLRILHEDEELDNSPGSHYSSGGGSGTKDVGVMASNPSFNNMQRQKTMESFSHSQ